MEADISIWRKPGHFYFALTRKPRKPTQADDESRYLELSSLPTSRSRFQDADGDKTRGSW